MKLSIFNFQFYRYRSFFVLTNSKSNNYQLIIFFIVNPLEIRNWTLEIPGGQL